VVRCKPDYKEGADQASPNALKLLKSILEKDPNKRLTPAQILDHPWMES
jgi:serine/threonine protein kinase